MDDMFQLLWQQYRTWADTSTHLRVSNTAWKRNVLVLTLAGTACATLGPFASGTVAGQPVTRVLAVAGAAFLGLATYFGKELLDTQHAERWTRARAAAEAFKSESCKYLMQVSPYDGPDRAGRLKARIDELSKVTKDQIPDTISPERRVKDMPAATWTTDDYLSKRIDDQVAYYEKKAGDHAAATTMGRRIAIGLGIGAVLLSAITGVTSDGPSIWAAVLGVVTTAAGSIGAYFQAGQFEAIALKYRQTALALRGLKAEFKTMGTPQNASDLVSKAEAIMQAENAAWLTDLIVKT